MFCQLSPGDIKDADYTFQWLWIKIKNWKRIQTSTKKIRNSPLGHRRRTWQYIWNKMTLALSEQDEDKNENDVNQSVGIHVHGAAAKTRKDKKKKDKPKSKAKAKAKAKARGGGRGAARLHAAHGRCRIWLRRASWPRLDTGVACSGLVHCVRLAKLRASAPRVALGTRMLAEIAISGPTAQESTSPPQT